MSNRLRGSQTQKKSSEASGSRKYRTSTKNAPRKDLSRTQKISRAQVSGRTSQTSRKDAPSRIRRVLKTSLSKPVSPRQTPRRHSAVNAATVRKQPEKKLLKGVKLDDLKFHSLLGEGAFSKVYLCRMKDKNVQKSLGCENMAVKVVPAKKEVRSMVWERHVLAQLRHPFIIGYHGSFTENACIFMMLDFQIGGEILYWFERAKHGRFDWESTGKFYIAEILCGLSYLHENDFVYRDLKPENVLLSKEGHVKIVDFGFAKKLEQKSDRAYTLCGSKEYVAPEVLAGRGYSYSVDVWSLGVLTYELICGHLPFDTQQCAPSEVLGVIKQTRVKFPAFVSSFPRDFIKKLLVLDPKKRLGCSRGKDINELKKHHCFSGIDWKVLENGGYEPPIKPPVKNANDVSYYEFAKFEDGSGQDGTFDFIDSQLDSHF